MKVRYKRISDKAVKPYKTYVEDFCYDVVATSCEEIAPNVYKYGIGLAFQIDRDAENPFISTLSLGCDDYSSVELIPQRCQLSIDLRPRSSVWKTGMVLSNCIGTIDELYTGEVSAVFYHVMQELPKYEIGDRIGQIKLGFTLPIQFVEVDELRLTKRANGGYGSTGK